MEEGFVDAIPYTKLRRSRPLFLPLWFNAVAHFGFTIVRSAQQRRKRQLDVADKL